jgi:hypothetical protein
MVRSLRAAGLGGHGYSFNPTNRGRVHLPGRLVAIEHWHRRRDADVEDAKHGATLRHLPSPGAAWPTPFGCGRRCWPARSAVGSRPGRAGQTAAAVDAAPSPGYAANRSTSRPGSSAPVLSLRPPPQPGPRITVLTALQAPPAVRAGRPRPLTLPDDRGPRRNPYPAAISAPRADPDSHNQHGTLKPPTRRMPLRFGRDLRLMDLGPPFDQEQQERAEQLGKQPAPFLMQIFEIRRPGQSDGECDRGSTVSTTSIRRACVATRKILREWVSDPVRVVWGGRTWVPGGCERGWQRVATVPRRDR